MLRNLPLASIHAHVQQRFVRLQPAALHIVLQLCLQLLRINEGADLPHEALRVHHVMQRAGASGRPNYLELPVMSCIISSDLVHQSPDKPTAHLINRLFPSKEQYVCRQCVPLGHLLGVMQSTTGSVYCVWSKPHNLGTTAASLKLLNGTPGGWQSRQKA